MHILYTVLSIYRTALNLRKLIVTATYYQFTVKRVHRIESNNKGCKMTNFTLCAIDHIVAYMVANILVVVTTLDFLAPSHSPDRIEIMITEWCKVTIKISETNTIKLLFPLNNNKEIFYINLSWSPNGPPKIQNLKN